MRMVHTSIYSTELREWDVNSAFHQGDRRHPYRVWFWKHVLATFHIQLDGAAILEVGCGAGFFTTLVSRKNNIVYGVDFSSHMIQAARLINSRVHFSISSAHKLPYQDEMFDNVVTAMLFHHLVAQDLLTPSIKEMSRVLKKNGTLCILDHAGNTVSNGMLGFLNAARKIVFMVKRNFSSSGSSHELPFNATKLVDSLREKYTSRSSKPVSTVFFQLFSTCSHMLEYLFSEHTAIVFEKITLPFVIFIENTFSYPWLCTEVAMTFIKKK